MLKIIVLYVQAICQIGMLNECAAIATLRVGINYIANK